MRFTEVWVILLLLGQKAMASSDLNIVFWIDPLQKDIYADIATTLKELEGLHIEAKITDSVVVIDNNEESQEKNIKTFCDILSYTGVSVVLDFTYHPWQQGFDYIQTHRIPYLRVGRMVKPFIDMFKAFAQQKDVTEIVILAQNQQDKREIMLEVVHGLPFRTLVLNAGDDDEADKEGLAKRLLSLRPSPGYYAIFARGSNMNAIFDKINQGGAFLRAPEWHFVFTDTRDRVFKYKKIAENANKFVVNFKTICRSLQMKDAYCQSGFTFQRALLLEIFRALIDIRQSNMEWLEPRQIECNDTAETTEGEHNDFDILDHFRVSDFMAFNTAPSPNNFEDHFDVVPPLSYRVNVSISFYSSEHDTVTDLASYQNEELKRINQTLTPAKRYFRIGTVESLPWSYHRRDPQTGEKLLDSTGNPIWEGFCIDMIQTLSEKLNFDYEIVTPIRGKFGRRDPKTRQWDGLVGDLVSGEADFVVAALKMYSEREEYIDYIAPYFEQTGITIVMRKPVRQTSLFKFMTVLRIEVWMSIVGALVSTAIMIWLLDKYSPYSARNNKKAYPYECREFTLRESFWFALTSFTPQGGGEVPKAVSARILVAAYWLFVVLMLATFTANLAAFLTVERMQTPVQSLEQLARQSRINYTVVDESDSHHYFINMEFAEKTLYRMWKELALNASRDFQKFRVWDYPIKEQYGRILLAINSSIPVKDVEEGFRKVNEAENADFAFIHDSSEIKYEITRNCNLTEVGEVFAEQPYAIAVQQGSHLADPLAYALLELQKDRYFEDLKAKYWNHSRSNCPLSEEEEGITLDSLGGVFIATLCGLGFALVSLVFEVFCYRKKLRDIKNGRNITQVKPLDSLEKPIEVWHSGKKKKLLPSPPPSFETATFRGRKIPSGIVLGSAFRPRQRPIRQLSVSDNEELPSSDGLPGYME